MDIPAELRVYIYQFLLPYNVVIKYNGTSVYHPAGLLEERKIVQQWRVAFRSKSDNARPRPAQYCLRD
jgi:hypothetical protein